jgi:hypothetical protein
MRLSLQARKIEESNDRARWFGIVHRYDLRPHLGAFVGPDAARLGAMNADNRAAAAIDAQASLDAACAALDSAVKSLVKIDGETVVASADLLALLLRVAEAQRSHADIASPRSAVLPASLR